MSKFTKRLQECSNVQEATTILNEMKAGPAMRKIVETAVMLKAHPDPIQRQYGYSFMQSAIQEADDDKAEEPTPHHGEEAPKPKNGEGDKPMKEEELEGGNQSGTGGSEQSTDNTEPYPLVATNTDEGEKPMDKATGENQMQENMGGFPGMIPGLEPSVASEMGNHMGPVPPMNTPQMMKQMQYTVNQALKHYVLPLRQVIKGQQEAIKILNKRVQESEARSGSMKIDLKSVKDHAMARPHIQETVQNFPSGPTIVGSGKPVIDELSDARASINQLDKQLRSKPTPYL